MQFSEFLKQVDAGQVSSVVIVGHDITGSLKKATTMFRTYAPDYQGLAAKLHEKDIDDPGQAGNDQSVGDAAVFLGADPADDRLLDFHHAADAERREQGPLVRQEPREAVVELAEEGHVQGRRRASTKRKKSSRKSSSS